MDQHEAELAAQALAAHSEGRRLRVSDEQVPAAERLVERGWLSSYVDCFGRTWYEPTADGLRAFAGAD